MTFQDWVAYERKRLDLAEWRNSLPEGSMERKFATDALHATGPISKKMHKAVTGRR